MATAQRSDFLIVAATLAAVAGGTLMVIAPRQTTKPVEIVVKGKPVAAPARVKLPPQGPRTPRETELQKKEVEIPRMRVPAPIVRPEKKGKKRPARSERPKIKRTASLPSCARIRAAYNRMSVAERWAAYQKATPEQVAHGRRCLGM